MQKKSLLIAVAVAGFIVALIVGLPARVLVYVLPSSVTAGMLSGSVWNGSAQYLTIGGRTWGPVKWQVHPLSLLAGKLTLDGELGSGDSQIRGRFSAELGGAIEGRKVEMRWPLSGLPLSAVPPGWNGNISATLDKIKLNKSGLQEVAGVLDARDLQRPAPDPVTIGSYRLSFDESSRQADKWIGRLQDTGGPMQVTGTVTLAKNREFIVEGLVTPRPGAPDAITNTLRFLGQPDAQGRRPFSVAGTY